MYKPNSLTKSVFFNILHQTLNVFFPLITYMYVARILHPEGIGFVSAAQNNVSYFSIIASLGIPAYGIREIAKVRDSSSDLNKVFSELLLLNAFFTIISFILLVVSIIAIPLFNAHSLLYSICGFTVVLNFINVEWLYRGMEDFSYIAIRNFIVKIFSLVLLVFMVRSSEDVYNFALVSILATSGNNIFNIIHSRKYVSITFKNLSFKRHLKALLFLVFCSISTELYARIDITMLNIMQNDTQVGLYSYAHRIVLLVTTFLMSVTTVFLPRLSYYYEHKRDEFERLVHLGFNMMIFLSFPISSSLLFTSTSIIKLLFGVQFEPASIILNVFLIMIPIKCVGDIVCYQVMMCARRESLLMKAYFYVVFINFVCNIILIPKFSACGAAMASVISELFAFLFVFLYSSKIMKFHVDRKNLVMSIFFSILIGGISFILNRYFQNDFLVVLCTILFGTLIYIAGNCALGNTFFLIFFKQLKQKLINRILR